MSSLSRPNALHPDAAGASKLEIMQLTVSGLDATLLPARFDHLFGRYVYGFKPWKHCDDCLVANIAPAIHPTMKDGTFELEDRLFYLCGVGHELSERLHPDLIRRLTNVHLAVRPRKGSVAAVGSVYGVTFFIKDAQAIPIETLPPDFRGLPEKHLQCKMFQFGFQMFDVDEVSETPREIVYQLRDRWRSTPGLTLTRADSQSKHATMPSASPAMV